MAFKATHKWIILLKEYNNKDEHYDLAWQLYIDAFLSDERRDDIAQMSIMQKSNYHFEVVSIDEQVAGILLWWLFDGIVYIEHFAIAFNQRGRGLGHELLRSFIIRQQPEVLILEVEPPVNENNKRRISFYESLGFHLNSYDYYQPPLKQGGLSVSLKLMSYPDLVDEIELESYKNQFQINCL